MTDFVTESSGRGVRTYLRSEICSLSMKEMILMNPRDLKILYELMLYHCSEWPNIVECCALFYVISRSLEK